MPAHPHEKWTNRHISNTAVGSKLSFIPLLMMMDGVVSMHMKSGFLESSH